MTDNFPYFLALNRINNVGPKTVKKLMKRWPLLADMFRLSASQLEAAGLPALLAKAITEFKWQQVEADLRWAETENRHLITWEDPHYPDLLKEIADPPLVLYAKGQLSALNGIKLAMVGSRNPTITGSENAKRFAKELARQGVIIVSGLALGIDVEAHKGCLEAGGKTVAVLGTGIDCIYPRRHAQIAEEIVQNGLVLTEFPLKSPPIAGHFPRRNRIISGLALCTLVVEAAIKSGSLITARMALEQNRDVLAIPGSIHNPLARGCHYLLQQGAKLVTSVKDILEELKIDQQSFSEEKLFSPLARGNKNLVKFIGFEITNIDQLIARSGYSVEQITVELTKLELQGEVMAVPGGYMRCYHER